MFFPKRNKRRRKARSSLVAAETCEDRMMLSCGNLVDANQVTAAPPVMSDSGAEQTPAAEATAVTESTAAATDTAADNVVAPEPAATPDDQRMTPRRPSAIAEQPMNQPQNSGRAAQPAERGHRQPALRQRRDGIRNPPPEVPVEVRSIDGTGNNLENPELGSTDEQLLRVAASDYADGISAPAGEDRPSAREISNALSAQQEDTLTNDRDLSAFLYVWGQFLDHDIDLTEAQEDGESFDISVPAGDASFDPNGTGTQTIPLTRSVFDDSTGTDSPREQITQITSWIDGSQIYGSDAETAASLRTFEGGRLLIGDDGLLPSGEDGSFLAGDIRANENIELSSMHTLFVREHNLQADRIAAENPGLSDEEIFQQARAIVIAELQAITFNEFLPALLGDGAVSDYAGYDPTVDPSIANEFSTAAFRFGHSTLNEDIEFFGNDGLPVRDEVALREAFFNPDLLRETGIDSVLKYVASSTAQEIDLEVVDSLRNFLFGEPGQGGLDLVSLNIQRGRDHGLADYNTVREAYGLTRVETFADITSDVGLQQTLEELYGTVDNIDLWVGGLAEDHVAGSSTGELFRTIIVDQFERLRDGDRFWYQNVFSGRELRDIEHTTLADIIQRNTGVSNIQDDVFVMTGEVSGRVVANTDGLARTRRGGVGVAGVTVELLNDEGTVIASTTTGSTGMYRFDDFDETGEYQLRIVPPSGSMLTTSEVIDILISRGGLSLSGLDFGLSMSDAGLV
ncbi:MAG: peroxidase family protein [Planctomycetaceae bacterium]